MSAPPFGEKMDFQIPKCTYNILANVARAGPNTFSQEEETICTSTAAVLSMDERQKPSRLMFGGACLLWGMIALVIPWSDAPLFARILTATVSSLCCAGVDWDAFAATGKGASP